MNTPRTDFVAHGDQGNIEASGRNSGGCMTNVSKAMEQEPVAWLVTYGGLTHIAYTKPTQVVDTHYQPLYAAQL